MNLSNIPRRRKKKKLKPIKPRITKEHLKQKKQATKKRVRSIKEDIENEEREREIRDNLIMDIEKELEEHPEAFEPLSKEDEKAILKIKNHDLEKDNLFISFRNKGKRSTFEHINEEIYNKL